MLFTGCLAGVIISLCAENRTLADAENDRVACSCRHRCTLWLHLSVRASVVDQLSQGAHLQEPIRTACHQEAQNDCRSHVGQLQPPGATVSDPLDFLTKYETAFNCSKLNVFRELSSTFARLCRTVDTATTDMNEELKTLEAQLNVLESNQKQLKLLRNKANYIQNELDIFEHNYIAPQ